MRLRYLVGLAGRGAGGNLITQCAPGAIEGYDSERAAIHNGGAGWLQIALQAGACIYTVVKDELASHEGCQLASVAPTVACPNVEAITQEERDRAQLAIATYELQKGALAK